MKIIPKLATGIVALGLMVGVARADTFDFSYLFDDGLTVTGSLDGHQNGLFIEDVTNVAVFFGTDALPGTVYTAQFDGATFLAGPIVSFDALQNNFVFSNTDLAGGDPLIDSIFYMFIYPGIGHTALANSTLGYSSNDDPIVASSWSLSRAAVPDQGTTLSLLALSLIGLSCLRSRFLSVRTQN